MAGRASIVGAAETNVGKVRDHNEDAHFIDPDLGIFVVCDGMGGHAAGEVASALAVDTIREQWSNFATQEIAERWLAAGTAEARRELLATIREGVYAAHDAILAEARRDRTKGGMGTTLVGAMIVGGDIVFAHCGDSRAYLVRDGIAMQLTEDHTLLARLLAAGVDVDVQGDGARFKSMLTNALGIGDDVKVSSFVVPLADGDRFLLCSDGVTEYVPEPEIGEVLCKLPSPARAAQRLVELALLRGGGDNATALVVRVLEAGETARPAELIQREDKAIQACVLWSKLNPHQRLRALRIALPRDHAPGERLPAQSLGDRVAWVIVEGELDQAGKVRGPGALIYPEALLADRPLPDKDGFAVARGEVRALALRSDDFRELCEDDADLGEALLGALAAEIAAGIPERRSGRVVVHGDADADGRGVTDPGLPIVRAEIDEDTVVGRKDARATEAALDSALSKITVDEQWAHGAKDDSPAPMREIDATSVDESEPESVIVVEADAPDEVVASPRGPVLRHRSLGDHSDAEISIEQLDDESAAEERDTDLVGGATDVEPGPKQAPPPPAASFEESSDPEIVIVQPGRAITANETTLVAGIIEPASKRAKTEP